MASVPPQGGRKHPQQELIQIDTTNILFICGGAFDGLEKIIEQRMDQKRSLKTGSSGRLYQIRSDSGVYRTCSGKCILRAVG